MYICNVFLQIFTDDINKAIELVLQNNGRSMDEKRRDINEIKFHLNTLRNYVTTNMQMLLLTDLLTLDDDISSVKTPKTSPILLRGGSQNT